jgi:hypothetical protein
LFVVVIVVVVVVVVVVVGRWASELSFWLRAAQHGALAGCGWAASDINGDSENEGYAIENDNEGVI